MFVWYHRPANSCGSCSGSRIFGRQNCAVLEETKSVLSSSELQLESLKLTKMDVDVPHINASELTFFESFRATFYVVLPSETYFEKSKDVPNYVAAAIPHFFILIFLEMLILYWKGKELRINDKLTSTGAGMYSQVLE